MSKQPSALDRTFFVSLVVKGVHGLIEIVLGLVLFASPAAIDHLVLVITRPELSREPNDLIASRLLELSHSLTGSSQAFSVFYLLTHGVVNLTLAIALLRQQLWAYPPMIGFVGLFTTYQIYRLIVAPSLGLFLLTAFDILIIWLTWHEYQLHRRQPNQPV